MGEEGERGNERIADKSIDLHRVTEKPGRQTEKDTKSLHSQKGRRKSRIGSSVSSRKWLQLLTISPLQKLFEPSRHWLVTVKFYSPANFTNSASHSQKKKKNTSLLFWALSHDFTSVPPLGKRLSFAGLQPFGCRCRGVTQLQFWALGGYADEVRES